MRHHIISHLQKAKSIQDAQTLLIRLFDINRFPRLGYAAGVITSDGPEKINENRRILLSLTQELRMKNPYPIFCAVDVFTDELLENINWHTLHSDHFVTFWRNILGSGFITDIYMTPRWQISNGAKDEYEIAKKEGLTIHYLENTMEVKMKK